MATEDHLCDYVFNSDNYSESIPKNVLPDKMECQRPAKKTVQGEFLCMIHLPIDEKTPKELHNYIQESIFNSARTNNFAGGKFHDLRLRGSVLSSKEDNPILLYCAEIAGNLDLSRCNIHHPVSLNGATINGDFLANNCEFQENFFANHVTFQGEVKVKGARFHRSVHIRNSDFNDAVYFDSCAFKSEAEFRDCVFDPNPFNDIAESQENYLPLFIDFSDLDCQSGLTFNGSEFHEYVTFHEISVEKTANFNSISFKGKAKENEVGSLDYENYSRRERYAREEVAQITGEFKTLHITYESIPNQPAIISIVDSNVSSGWFDQNESIPVYYDFTNTTLGDVQLNRSGLDDPFSYLIFDQTDFDGFDFTSYRNSLENCDYLIDELNDTYSVFTDRSIEDRETIYLKAKLGANQASDRLSASKFHIIESDMKRRRYRRDNDWKSYFPQLVYSLTSRYGEKPSRVILFFIPLIVSVFLINITTISILHLVTEVLLLLLPPVFSALLVFTSSRYIDH